MKIYLDTSGVAKRYLDEPGSDIINSHYKKAWTGKDILFLSIWNMGEFIDILTRKERKGELATNDFDEIMKDFQGEMIGLRGRRSIIVIPLTNDIIERSWEIAIKERIYVPDALQIATALDRHCELVLSGDNSLVEHASKFLPAKLVGGKTV